MSGRKRKLGSAFRPKPWQEYHSDNENDVPDVLPNSSKIPRLEHDVQEEDQPGSDSISDVSMTDVSMSDVSVSDNHDNTSEISDSSNNSEHESDVRETTDQDTDFHDHVGQIEPAVSDDNDAQIEHDEDGGQIEPAVSDDNDAQIEHDEDGGQIEPAVSDDNDAQIEHDEDGGQIEPGDLLPAEEHAVDEPMAAPNESYNELLESFSREWLLIEIQHQVSKVASNEFWKSANKHLYKLLAAKEAQNVTRKVPQFVQLRRKFNNVHVPEIKMEFGYRNKETGEITVVKNRLTTPINEFPPSTYKMVYEIAKIEVRK